MKLPILGLRRRVGVAGQGALCIRGKYRPIEPLVPGAVRNVAPRLMGFVSVGVTQSGTVLPTVPATPGALVEVGREPSLDQVGDAETMEDMLDALAVDLEADDGARSLDESFGPEVFPLTDDATLEMPQRRGRRLVLVPMPGESPHSHPDVELLEGEAFRSIDDTESVAVQDRGSEVSEDETLAPASVPDPLVMATRGWTPAVRASGVVG